MEFHISRAVRDKLNTDELLFSYAGNVIFGNVGASRKLASQLNNARDTLVEALDHIGRRSDDIRSKASREFFNFCLGHPRLLSAVLDRRLDHSQWVNAWVATGRAGARRFLRAVRSRWTASSTASLSHRAGRAAA